MGIEVTRVIALEKISKMLAGCSIDKVEYYITGWELRIIGSPGLEFLIVASEISAPGLEQWWASLEQPNFSLTDTNEPKDTTAAIVIFTVLNRWPITKIDLDEKNNLFIYFENMCILKAVSEVEGVDWTWSIRDMQNKGTITCDSDGLYESV